MSEKKARNADVRPKCNRSRSADSYAWSGKKRSRGVCSETAMGISEGEGAEHMGRSASCPRRRRERKCSCDGDCEPPCRKALSRRSLRQKFQDAVGQCFPIRTHHHHQPGAPRPLSVLLWSKRKIHVSELMQDKCPFSPKSELAHCWHLIKKHTSQQGSGKGLGAEGHGERRSASPPPLISWEEISSLRSHGGGECNFEDWELSNPSEASPLTGSIPCLVPDLLQINNSSCYWGVLDRYEAEELLEGQPEGTFLLRDSAQEEFLFSVSFRRYSRSLHARIEQSGKRFSFDGRDPCVYRDPSVTGLLQHYSDPATCLFFEPLLSRPLPRTFPFSLQHLCRAVICSRTTYQAIDTLPLPTSLRDYLRQYHYKSAGACAV
ncbi:suppressor of cytokine signaling 4 [Amia ocellicauda]|uniref:suppressor of cytokine signaling 4 n=1 Tax=Amia ocellicauda TaxID=2972642 RepID=UPI0034638732|nr:SOCS4 protein [Amia calva]